MKSTFTAVTVSARGMLHKNQKLNSDWDFRKLSFSRRWNDYTYLFASVKNEKDCAC